MRPVRLPGWLSGFVLLVVATLSACSAGGTDPGSAPAGPGADPAAQSVLNAAADVDAQLRDARNRLYDKCMSAKGFTVHPKREPTDGASFTAKAPPSPRPENVADARRYGYRIHEGPQGEPVDKTANLDPFDQLPEDVRRQYDQALTGPGNPTRSEKVRPGDKERDIFVMPDGNKQFVYKHGCQPETDHAVLGDMKRYIELQYAASSGLDRTVHDAAWRAPEVSSAQAAWIDCMSGKGYPTMRDPVDAAKRAEDYYRAVDARNPDAVRQARDKETAQAVAHAECAEQTKVDEKLRTAWHREYGAYLAAHEADLVAWQEFAKDALTRAQQMLAG